jgi:CobQ-like glutamine amidotransferase family enzyme
VLASVKGSEEKDEEKATGDHAGKAGACLCHGVLLPRVPALTPAQRTYKEALSPLQEAHRELMDHCEVLSSLQSLK